MLQKHNLNISNFLVYISNFLLVYGKWQNISDYIKMDSYFSITTTNWKTFWKLFLGGNRPVKALNICSHMFKQRQETPANISTINLQFDMKWLKILKLQNIFCSQIENNLLKEISKRANYFNKDSKYFDKYFTKTASISSMKLVWPEVLRWKVYIQVAKYILLRDRLLAITVFSFKWETVHC